MRLVLYLPNDTANDRRMRGKLKNNARANLTIAIPNDILDQLKNISESRGQSVNTKTNQILAKYLQFYLHVEEKHGIILPHEIWKEIVILVDEKKLTEMLQRFGVETAVTLFDHYNIPVTLDNVIKYCFETMMMWSGSCHRISLHKESSGNFILVLEHDFGIKWSKALGDASVSLIKEFVGLSAEYTARSATVTIKVKT